MKRLLALAASLAAFVVLMNACGGGGSSGSTPAVELPPAVATVPFDGGILIGAPTDTGVQVSVLSKQQSGSLQVTYGRVGSQSTAQTPLVAFSAGTPTIVTLANLVPDSSYFYRLEFGSGTAIKPTSDYTFHTARPSGASFVFTVQADSHLDENSDLAQYQLTLSNVLSDRPDFHIDLGDTFMTEKHGTPLSATSPPAADWATVAQRYQYERGNYAAVSHSVPLFLVNGNHDAENGWLRSASADTLPVWATTARKKFFLNPVPGSFYAGDSYVDPIVGERAAWYSWQWGDALFVVLDPFWNTPAQPNKDAWNLTLGAAQYQWLADTLARSSARFKFVFIHNLVGGLDGQMRGGIEAAPHFEWGGKNADGSVGFGAKRPGWALPIHDLLVRNKVTAVFHGHDHVYVKQELDGIVYQTVPQPSAVNTSNGPSIAQAYHYASGTVVSSSGHLRVTVTPGAVTSEYVRSWLPAAESATRQNRSVDDRWTVAAK